MPLKLVPPREGKSPNWSIRGTYLRVYVDKSSGTDRRPVARRIRDDLQRAIERGEYPARKAPAGGEQPTFLSAAVAYMEADGCPKYLAPLIKHFGETPLHEIDQTAIDAAAIAVKPNVTAATRNRKVYTPISAVLAHAGVKLEMRRPKGAKGRIRTDFLTPDDAGAIIDAAEVQDRPFALLLTFLLYTGVRIGEALALQWEDTALDERLARVGMSKNGDPRTMVLRVDLRDALVQHRGDKRHGQVFKMRRGGGLKDRLTRAKLAACGVEIPRRSDGASRRIPPHRLSWVTFHTFRHSWASWMRRYGGADLQGLVATGNWRDARSAARYAHVVARDEWNRVELLPSITARKA